MGGVVHEPSTVVDKFDITSDATIAVPLIIDALEKKVIWCDLATSTIGINNAHSNMNGIQATLSAMVNVNKPNMYDLLLLHAKARGKMVNTISGADVVLSVSENTHTQLEEFSSKYMI